MKYFLSFAIVFSLSFYGYAEDTSVDTLNEIRSRGFTKDQANNLSHEFTICTAVFHWVGTCFENTEPGSGKDYFEAADISRDFAAAFSVVGNVSPKAIAAKLELAQEEIESQTENGCQNIAVIHKSHFEPCLERLEGWKDNK